MERKQFDKENKKLIHIYLLCLFRIEHCAWNYYLFRVIRGIIICFHKIAFPIFAQCHTVQQRQCLNH